MSKANSSTSETAAACEEIQAGMLEACRKFAAENGLSIESAGWRGPGSDFAFHLIFRVRIAAPDGKPLGLDKEMFALLAEQYGLRASDFHREFVDRGQHFRIIGIDPRRPKYPISVERVPDRRGFKFPADEVLKLLNEGAKP